MIGVNASYHNESSRVGNYEIKKTFFLGKLTGGNQDSFSFSAAGMRLNILFKGQKIEQVSVRTWDTVLGDIKNLQLKDADDHIAATGKSLERMLEIAEAAQDPSLSTLERIDMQIELGHIQHEMDEKNIPAGKLGFKNYEDTHSYKMLLRARDRISKGLNWNVREVRHTIIEDAIDKVFVLEPDVPDPGVLTYEEVRGLYETGAWVDYLKSQRPEWRENTYFEESPRTTGFDIGGEMRADPDDSSAMALGYVWAITDDASVPTVGDILKIKGRSVMDEETAYATTEELKQKLNGLERHREKLVSLAAEFEAVQSEPQDSVEKQIILNKIMNFQASTLQNYFEGVFKESFMFAYGNKYNVFGKSSEEMRAMRYPTIDSLMPRND